ncbi:hypothetical protein CVT24_009925 [Panaeolus cyanescens]|uniref:Uncharacterized protein n=1 Tax=Panaeolus cyanescens TaxID=181874 RepID=A0A409WLY0_9AGAR|nr:hypothetical protein CVT24_009925 [Panaeolus cyanescens]
MFFEFYLLPPVTTSSTPLLLIVPISLPRFSPSSLSPLTSYTSPFIQPLLKSHRSSHPNHSSLLTPHHPHLLAPTTFYRSYLSPPSSHPVPTPSPSPSPLLSSHILLLPTPSYPHLISSPHHSYSHISSHHSLQHQMHNSTHADP